MVRKMEEKERKRGRDARYLPCRKYVKSLPNAERRRPASSAPYSSYTA